MRGLGGRCPLLTIATVEAVRINAAPCTRGERNALPAKIVLGGARARIGELGAPDRQLSDSNRPSLIAMRW